jgi:hypothetical protein
VGGKRKADGNGDGILRLRVRAAKRPKFVCPYRFHLTSPLPLSLPKSPSPTPPPSPRLAASPSTSLDGDDVPTPVPSNLSWAIDCLSLA